jgi:hypothetical protein
MSQDQQENKITPDEFNRYRNILFNNDYFKLEDTEKYPQLVEYIEFEENFNKKSAQYFNEFKKFVHIKNIISNKIQSKKYIIELDEYSAMYN